jgi:hypothetical protein
MPELPRPRPALAIVICIYEALIVVFGLLGFAMRAVTRSLSTAAAALPTSALTTALSLLGILLALGIAVTLWQMSRNAFYLAAARFGLDLIGFVYLVVHPIAIPTLNKTAGQPQLPMHAIAAAAIVVEVIFLAINAGIAFYAHYVTRPLYLADTPTI